MSLDYPVISMALIKPHYISILWAGIRSNVWIDGCRAGWPGPRSLAAPGGGQRAPMQPQGQEVSSPGRAGAGWTEGRMDPCACYGRMRPGQACCLRDSGEGGSLVSGKEALACSSQTLSMLAVLF